jgi:succinyl-CoA synthetase beta subunit
VKIQEHQARDIFKKYGLPVKDWGVATTPDEAVEIARRLKLGEKDGLSEVVIKSQVLVGGRGKAGGIKFARTVDEAREVSKAILGMNIKGLKVEKVMIADPGPKENEVKNEYYMAIVMDRDRKCHVAIASTAGGVDIEQVAEATPEKIGKIWIDHRYGLHQYEAKKMLFDLGFDQSIAAKAAAFLCKLYQITIDLDCSLCEINPLVLSTSGEILPVDAKINFDDSGLYRHPELKTLKESEDTDPIEKEAHSRGLTYVRLDGGNVGIIGNGAGLVMSTMDEVKRFGKGIATPANFLDIGGGAQAEVVKNSLEVVLMDPNVRTVLINVFGGITRCDEVAKGLNEAVKGIQVKVPIIVRLAGTNVEEGRKILDRSLFGTVETLDDAADQIVNYVSQSVAH